MGSSVFNGVILPILGLIGGLVMFLFGMKVMGNALEQCAGKQMKNILAKLTSNTFMGFLLGFCVTAVIQSSGATTVMVVGFVNSGIMTLHQATGVIMGANLGTSVTSWLLSLSSISGGDGSLWFLNILKPSTFVPILGLVGIYFYMFQKNGRRKNYGLILLGFSVLMQGMSVMSSSMDPIVSGEGFQEIVTAFSNPLIGLAVGIGFTALLQSSSASVGILQAMSLTGAITYSVAAPFLNGANIGACICSTVSAIGANKEARRSAGVNLIFNVLSAILCMGTFYGLNAIIGFDFLSDSIPTLGIAMMHSGFKIFSLIFLLPASRLIEKIALLLVPDNRDGEDHNQLLDDRLIATPAVAIERARKIAVDMADLSVSSLRSSLNMLNGFSEKMLETVYEQEERVDKYEDALGTYLIKISSCQHLNEQDSHEVAKLLHIIGDFERISDHAVNIAESAKEMMDKKLVFSGQAIKEINVMVSAINEIMTSALDAFCTGNMETAFRVEPLEEVVDGLNAKLKKRHVERLQKGECTIELGFVLSDLLTNMERVSDHCSNVAGCVIEMAHDALDVHEYMEKLKTEGNPKYIACYNAYKEKYRLPPKPVEVSV